MKEKKHSANWNIAATHYLTSGFAIPLVVNLIGGVLIALILPVGIIRNIGVILLSLLGVWWGVQYSAGYLKKTYIVTDKNKIINLTVTYFVVIAVIYLVYRLTSGKIIAMDMIFDVIRLVGIGIILYVSSQKYIQEDSQPAQTV